MQACYARQSVDKKDSISIETQLEKAHYECDPSDIIEDYTDKGYSGKNTRRPEWQRMMHDVKAGNIKRIVVYRIDRFSRSLLDFSNAWEILAAHKVDFVSVNEKFDTGTPIGKAMLFILMVFAQLERETIAERVTDNYYARTKQGNWPGGPAPYGFDNGRITIDGRKIPTLIPNEKMDTVKEIFDIYASEPGATLGSIATYLMQKKIPAPGKANWTNVSLSRLIKNPVYVKVDADIYTYYKDLGVTFNCSLEEFNGVFGGILVGKRNASTRKRQDIACAKFNIGNWEGNIDAATWLACQYRVRKNQQIKNTGKGKYTWLSGMMSCSECGRSIRAMIDHNSLNRTVYLNCTGHIEHSCSNIIKIRAAEVESIVGEELTKILESCEDEPVVLPDTNLMTPAEKIELREIEDRIQNLVNVIASGDATKDTMRYINSEIERIEKRRAQLSEAAMQEATRQSRKVVFEHVDFRKLEFDERKIVATTYIEKVIVHRNEIEIVWRV